MPTTMEAPKNIVSTENRIQARFPERVGIKRKIVKLWEGSKAAYYRVNLMPLDGGGIESYWVEKNKENDKLIIK